MGRDQPSAAVLEGTGIHQGSEFSPTLATMSLTCCSTRASLKAPQKPQDAPLQPVIRSPGQGAGDEANMAAMGAKLQGDARSRFLFEGDASGKHEGIVQGVDDQGRRGDDGQVAAATSAVVIVEDTGEAAQGAVIRSSKALKSRIESRSPRGRA